MKKIITLNIAIAAYNAEKNIKRLAESMLNQEEHSFILKKLIINSDSSTDNTVKIAKSIKDTRLKVIDSNARTGFAGVVVSLSKTNDSDILLILNDDIIIKDMLFLEKIIQPFIKNENIGLACANVQPMKSDIFISEAVRSGFNAYKKIGEYIQNGNNVFTADGKSLCLSQKFINSIKFPKDYSEMANVDSFIYFTCKANGFEYTYSKKSLLFFKCPSTIKDFTKWQIRSYRTNSHIIPAKFGVLAKKELKMPRIVFNYFKFIEFIKNPLGSIIILLLGLYCSYKARMTNGSFNTTWDLVQSTKNI